MFNMLIITAAVAATPCKPAVSLDAYIEAMKQAMYLSRWEDAEALAGNARRALRCVDEPASIEQLTEVFLTAGIIFHEARRSDDARAAFRQALILSPAAAIDTRFAQDVNVHSKASEVFEGVSEEVGGLFPGTIRTCIPAMVDGQHIEAGDTLELSPGLHYLYRHPRSGQVTAGEWFQVRPGTEVTAGC